MRADDVYAILNKRIKNIQTAVTGGSSDTPVGAVISYMGTTAPANYLVCDGSAYNISEYQELASHFTNEFGSVNYFGGDGETTFAVPDLRGEFLRGSGTAERNSGSGANVGVHQNATLQPYIGYNKNDPSFWTDSSIFPDGKATMGPSGCDKVGIASSTTGRSVKLSNWNGASGIATFTARPTNTAVLYCIKCQTAVKS